MRPSPAGLAGQELRGESFRAEPNTAAGPLFPAGHTWRGCLPEAAPRGVFGLGDSAASCVRLELRLRNLSLALLTAGA